jgi:hypothetical protein
MSHIQVMPSSNHRYRRMLSRLPEEMKSLMSLCDREVVILAHNAGSMAWHVDFQIDRTEFRLEYDRGFLMVVKDPAGEARALAPEKGTWFSEVGQALPDETADATGRCQTTPFVTLRLSGRA